MAPLSSEPCVLSWLLCACLVGYLEEWVFEPRLWVGEEEERAGALLLLEPPIL